MQNHRSRDVKALAFFIGVALLLVFSASFKPLMAARALPHQFDICLSAYPRSGPQIHPVLKTRANCSLGDKHLTARDFHALNRFVIPMSIFSERVSFFEWKQYFGRVEAEAAWQLCMRSVGGSKQELLALAGIPTFVSTCKTKDRLLNGKECYLYQIGAGWIPLLFVFEGDKCIRADLAYAVLGRDVYEQMLDDRSAYISKFAIGKTEQQIRLEIKHPIWNTQNENGVEALYMVDRVDALLFVYSFGRCVRVEKRTILSF